MLVVMNCRYNSSSFFCVFLSLIFLLYCKKSEIVHNLSSSAYCQNSKFGNKICVFKNLCYSKETGFVFILSRSSVLSGIQSVNDLKLIKTCSVSNNSAFYLNLNTVLLKHYYFSDVEWFDDVFAIHRFKPDNLMHVIHDDLLPIHNAYLKLCLDVQECRNRFRLLFLDGNDNGPFIDWYKAYSSQNPLYSSNFDSKNVCFSKIYFYLDEETVFYQYGYKIAHGPVPSTLSPTMLYNFREYILNYFEINRKHNPHNVYTIISRKSNRKIINVDDIERMIKSVVDSDFQIIKIDVMQNPMQSTLKAVSNSKLLIGMHGGGMILSIFLPCNSSVIELFPYGIQKEHVSPLLSLSKYRVHFIYDSWTNFNKNNSVPHPGYPKHLGGISHLSISQQEIIKNTDLVPPVVCCDNPLYLFRMYQDTFVDHNLLPVLNNSLNFKVKDWDIEKDWFFPGQVRNFSIRVFNTSLESTWLPPFNVPKDAVFSITLVTSVKNFSFLTDQLYYKIDLKTKIDFCQGWISCIFAKVYGTDSFSTCTF